MFEVDEHATVNAELRDVGNNLFACRQTDFIRAYDAEDVEDFVGNEATWAEVMMHMNEICENVGISRNAQGHDVEKQSAPSRPGSSQEIDQGIEQSDEDDGTFAPRVGIECGHRVSLPPLEQRRSSVHTPARPTGMAPEGRTRRPAPLARPKTSDAVEADVEGAY
eukprot:TRINITY_DN5962_c0_g1_i2.p1 TRINITY_DN5962_c0_g1~~TRINITY_DN5962_c0_g1_i2.p1  ORF type:complete len:165 (+),score=38.51 TRINITY_DN5962_c0_g1_i2:399-893(+)